MEVYKISTSAVTDPEGREVLPAFTALGSSEQMACYIWVTLANADYLKQCEPGTNRTSGGYFCETLLNSDTLETFASLQDYFTSFYTDEGYTGTFAVEMR